MGTIREGSSTIPPLVSHGSLHNFRMGESTSPIVVLVFIIFIGSPAQPSTLSSHCTTVFIPNFATEFPAGTPAPGVVTSPTGNGSSTGRFVDDHAQKLVKGQFDW